MSKKPLDKKIVAQNRKARFNYTILESFEVGVVLVGSEVKSLRAGKANIGDSYADIEGNEVILRQMHITEYSGANRFNHYPTRERKLLLHKSQIRKLLGKIKTKGVTLVPLSVYFNDKNRVKIDLAIASGKKNHDKREAIKNREWNIQKARILKNSD